MFKKYQTNSKMLTHLKIEVLCLRQIDIGTLNWLQVLQAKMTIVNLVIHHFVV